MTPETQALVRYDMEEDATHGVVALQRPDGIWVHYDAAVAALSTLSRDLATARQERDAALVRLGQEQMQRRKEVADLTAAVQAVRQELAKYQSNDRRINKGLSSGESK
jgi:hypothetical protein